MNFVRSVKKKGSKTNGAAGHSLCRIGLSHAMSRSLAPALPCPICQSVREKSLCHRTKTVGQCGRGKILSVYLFKLFSIQKVCPICPNCPNPWSTVTIRGQTCFWSVQSVLGVDRAGAPARILAGPSTRKSNTGISGVR